MTRSYASGVANKPLIGETIGENLERTVARFGDREALVVRHQQVRLTYAELNEQVDALARGLLGAGLEKGDRVGIWAPNCAEWVLTQYATAKAGIILVNVNPAYRTSELEYALRQSGCRMLVAARSHKTSDYAAMIDEVRGELPDLERVVLLDSPDWEELLRRRRPGAGPGGARLRRRDQHPVHERHHRLPEGRHAQPPQHPQQRVLRRRGLRLRRARPRLHPGAVLPLLRHGDGQPRLHHARLGDGDPGGRVRAGRRAGGRAGGALHEPLRRADDVHRRAQPPGVRALRPVQSPHRDHGRLAVPDRGHEAGDRAHAHGRGDDLLRHDRDLAGVDADGGRRLAREAHADRRPRAPAPRGQADRAAHRRHRPARRARRAAHARLLGDGGLLERPRAHRRGGRRARLDAHRRPRDDGRRGLPQHRRPLEGHGHPRRREHLSARGRGVPPHPPRTCSRRR